MSLLKKTKQTIRTILGRLSLIKVMFLLIAIVAFFSAVAMTVSSQTGFCNSCHIMNDYYASWEKSTHQEISCLSCHLQPGFTGYIRGKINGLAQAVDCMVGRVGTKAEATVLDMSCLRSACHNEQELLEDKVSFGTVKFTHKGHVGERYDGVNITCGTCHNHTDGQEHFSVDKDVCYTCHFVRSDENGDAVAESQCLDCHDLPSGVIDRGLVTIDHQDFVSYDVNCENSCHKRQIEHVSQVSKLSCLHCHTFSMSGEETSEQLHDYHTSGEKVECFECHGKVDHGSDQTSSVATMISCENCHSDTHAVQQTIFSADQQPHEQGMNEKVLSPMFLTHVECTGCHVERKPSEKGVLNSVGTVARATPQSCDNCHEPGTGLRYIPFWQSNIKELYGQILKQADALESRISLLSDKDKSVYADKINQARAILESVKADGSWGVHNLKYTESLLLKAKERLNKVEEEVR
ncbi:MAG: NapC/NirT family cytochrome c [Planctomycetes bacterium]|nr:NapC/NirT family cytochrome c [Planctomycetota bacterium]